LATKADVDVFDRYPDIYGIRAAESCRARHERLFYCPLPDLTLCIGTRDNRHARVGHPGQPATNGSASIPASRANHVTGLEGRRATIRDDGRTRPGRYPHG